MYVRFVRIDFYLKGIVGFGDESRTALEVDNGEERNGIVVCVLELNDAAFRCSSFGSQAREVEVCAVQSIADVNTRRVAWDLIEHRLQINGQQGWSHNAALF